MHLRRNRARHIDDNVLKFLQASVQAKSQTTSRPLNIAHSHSATKLLAHPRIGKATRATTNARDKIIGSLKVAHIVKYALNQSEHTAFTTQLRTNGGTRQRAIGAKLRIEFVCFLALYARKRRQHEVSQVRPAPRLDILLGYARICRRFEHLARIDNAQNGVISEKPRKRKERPAEIGIDECAASVQRNDNPFAGNRTRKLIV